jgi:hypothetical protein
MMVGFICKTADAIMMGNYSSTAVHSGMIGSKQIQWIIQLVGMIMVSTA